MATIRVEDREEELFITRDKEGQATLRVRNKPNHQEVLKRGEKMRYLRERMTMVRQRKEVNEMKIRDKLDRKGRKTKTYKGAKILEAIEKTLDDIQVDSEVVIIGSAVCALYPSLTDIEVAIICYQAILDSDVVFKNFNFRVASIYIAMHMTEEEQQRSPLYRILPREQQRMV